LLEFGWTDCVSEFLGNWDDICCDHFLKQTISDSLSGCTREETMTGECIDLIGTFLLKHLGSLA
jgi:hypothetical protein